MRDTRDLPERFYEIYAVDNAQHWQGAVSLDVLLRSRRPVPLADLIDEDRRRVSVLDDQAKSRGCSANTICRSPVVDTTNRLVGVITIDDVVDVIEEEADEDLKALGGVTQRRRLVRQRLDHRARSFQLAPGSISPRVSCVLRARLFEGQLEKMVALAVLARSSRARAAMPRPNHDVAVRALATRDSAPITRFACDARRPGRLVNGLALPSSTGIAAVAWFKIPRLGS